MKVTMADRLKLDLRGWVMSPDGKRMARFEMQVDLPTPTYSDARYLDITDIDVLTIDRDYVTSFVEVHE